MEVKVLPDTWVPRLDIGSPSPPTQDIGVPHPPTPCLTSLGPPSLAGRGAALIKAAAKAEGRGVTGDPGVRVGEGGREGGGGGGEEG